MSAPPRALVVGAGLAGSAVAAVLARRGTDVTLVAPPPGSDDAASGVPAAVMAPPVGRPGDPLSRIRLRGATCTRAWIAALAGLGIDPGRVADGVAIVPTGERARARHARLPDDASHARLLGASGTPAGLGAGTAWHGLGACLRPAVFAAGLRAAAGTRLQRVHGHVQALVADGEGWAARGTDGAVLARGAPAIVAAGATTASLLPSLRPFLHPARGQATAFSAAAAGGHPRWPISGGGYLTPELNGRVWAGATLQRGDTDTTARDEDDARNLAFARDRLGLPATPVALERFVGIRTTTPNRIPLVGACRDGMWVSAGHGAHGLLTALLAAHLLADALAHRPHPWLRLTAPDQRRDRGRKIVRRSP